MLDRNLTSQSHNTRFGAQFLTLALALAIGGCAATPKDFAAGRTPDGSGRTSTAVAGQYEPGDGPDEVVEQRSEDGTLLSTAEGWRDVDGNFVHHGAYTVYWENGEKKTVVYYRNGERHGDRRSWYADGKLWKSGWHDDGRATGTWAEWYANETKAREMTFINGGLNGWMTEWYPDGQIKHKVMYVAGLRQGRETRWDIDGALLSEADYLDDVMQP